MFETTQSTGHAIQRFSVQANAWTQRQSSVLARFIDPTHSVLEYGCEDGVILAALAGGVKAGIEPNPTLAATAARTGIDVRPSANAFAGETFDRIFCGDEIDKLPDLAQVLGALHPLLSNDGLLLLSQPLDTAGNNRPPPRLNGILAHVQELLAQAGYTPHDVSVQRHSYRSAGFQFRAKEKTAPDAPKTYWMVKPFLSLVAVARKTS